MCRHVKNRRAGAARARPLSREVSMGSLKHNYYTLQSTQSPPHVGDELCTHYYHTLHGQGAHTGHTPRGAIVARRVHCAVEQAQRSAREGGSLAHERPHHTRPARRPHARRGWRIEVAHAACFCTLSLNSHSHSHHVDHVRLRLPTNGWGWGGWAWTITVAGASSAHAPPWPSGGVASVAPRDQSQPRKYRAHQRVSESERP